MEIDELKGLSKAARLALKRMGITTLYPPQEAAVNAGLLDGENVVVAAPTASGKTLIAMMAALKHLHEGRGKVVYLTPLRALAYEKYEEFSELARELGFKVAVSFGDYDSSDPWLGNYDVIIVTNEKMDSLIRHGAPWLHDVSLFVIDEIHLIHETKRGPVLELLISRLKRLKPDAQLIALSATIANLEEIAGWLGGKPVASDWRPVRLREGVYYDGEIIFGDGDSREVSIRYESPALDLTHDSLADGGQVLVFTLQRRNAVNMALKLGGVAEKFLSERQRRTLRRMAMELLSRERNHLTEKLAACVLKGASFHHAGLSHLARKFVEDAFRAHLISVVVATPTLAAGVNLPARRVIIVDRRRYNVELGIREEISVMEYKQMAGRAGRPRYDNFGESVLIARTLDEAEFLLNYYVKAEPEKIRSQLLSEETLRSQILAEVASGLARSAEELNKTLQGTLYVMQFGEQQLLKAAEAALLELERGGFVNRIDGRLAATPLGERVSQLYVDPRTASRLLDVIAAKDEPLGDLAYLQLICLTPDMVTVYVRRHDMEMLEAVFEEYAADLIPLKIDAMEDYQQFASALKTALILKDWIEEVPDTQIYLKYDIGPGDLYSITQTGEWLLYAASELARLMGLQSHFRELAILKERVKHGVKKELLELVSIRGIGRVRERALYSHGYKSIMDIVNASKEELARVPGIGDVLAEKLKRVVEGEAEVVEAEGINLSDFM